MARNQVFVTFNGGSLLILTQWSVIPVAVLKSIPYFIGETTTMPIEHIQDIANICSVHNITQDDVAVRLFATSLKGKAL